MVIWPRLLTIWEKGELLELVDHHKIGDITTNSPIFFYTKPVGCTGTLLKELYDTTITPDMMKRFNFTTKMRVPKVEKIVVSMGLGEAVGDTAIIDEAVRSISAITGQKPVVTKARKDVANFKVRKGVIVGCKVTLRAAKMYEFLDRLISIAIPRMKDFRGLSANCFDGSGNYAMGITDQTIFPEVDVDKISKVRGMNIVIQTTARNDEEAWTLLKSFGMPFRA